MSNNSQTATINARNLLNSKPLAKKSILIVTGRTSLPSDRHIWLKARTLKAAGAVVSVICPLAADNSSRYEELDGIHIYRYPTRQTQTNKVWSHLSKYFGTLFWQTWLSAKIHIRHGFDVIHGTNPPDITFLVALPYKIMGKYFIFDQHSSTPQFLHSRFSSTHPYYRLANLFETLSYRTADKSIVADENLKRVALTGGRMTKGQVTIIRNILQRPETPMPNIYWKNKRRYLVVYDSTNRSTDTWDYVFETVDHIRHRVNRRDIQFCILHPHATVPKIDSRHNQVESENFVTLVSTANKAQIHEIMSTADIFIDPTKVTPTNYQSARDTIFKYLSYAKPIIQLDGNLAREVTCDTALHIAPNDPAQMANKIVDLIEDEKARRLLAKRAKTSYRNEPQLAKPNKAAIRLLHRLTNRHQSPVKLKCWKFFYRPKYQSVWHPWATQQPHS